MIAILVEPTAAKIAAKIEADILAAFRGNVKVVLLVADAKLTWPEEQAWDDLLLILYDGDGFSDAGNGLIDEYAKKRGERALVLPVAVDITMQKPPVAAQAIKALPYDREAEGVDGRLINRIGGMLGLRWQARDSNIFISYRAVDGAAIANQLFDHLKSLGHRPWLDQAQELDGNTTILPGTPVQAQIDSALEKASLVLLLDTPSALESPWIRHEVDTADAMLVPILPLCFRDERDKKHGPRFRSLVALQRWLSFRNPEPTDVPPLSDNQLTEIVDEAETYLCEIFRRKCRVPFIVEQEFVSYGYDWAIRDKPLFMFESTKSGGRIRTRVITHCSIFDQIYGPSITRFRSFINKSGPSNYSLFIYDGDLLSNIDLEELIEGDDDPVIVLHHQELSALINSNFSNLGTK